MAPRYFCISWLTSTIMQLSPQNSKLYALFNFVWYQQQKYSSFVYNIHQYKYTFVSPKTMKTWDIFKQALRQNEWLQSTKLKKYKERLNFLNQSIYYKHIQCIHYTFDMYTLFNPHISF